MASHNCLIVTYERLPFFVAEGHLSDCSDFGYLQRALPKKFAIVTDILNVESYLIASDEETQSKVVFQWTCVGKIALLYFSKAHLLQNADDLNKYLDPIKHSLKIINNLLKNKGNSEIVLDKLYMDVTEKQTN